MVAYDVFLADCPAPISDTWSVVVITALGSGPARYGELRAKIGGISNKMLARTLRRLAGNGLVERRELRTAPPTSDAIGALSRWAEENTDALLAARSA
ncbi:transcriptional regulator [Actinomadura sp. LD22]|uniref:Transcriptional regulator n=1 Tax=Actinomadura physcomitrii TaxID=2650748 RepID=A0A6I4M3A3_9ACTN|nr:helix-turn-helix domain-containing protein [Actinomadura physcomitrii]MVZ98793.1 transcriptional regulator [Actinomadura physcomitrii]